jgi:DNA-binding response OmpR family regulator
MRGNSRRLFCRLDVAFLDVGLPGKNGHEVARQIREQS